MNNIAYKFVTHLNVKMNLAEDGARKKGGTQGKETHLLSRNHMKNAGNQI